MVGRSGKDEMTPSVVVEIIVEDVDKPEADTPNVAGVDTNSIEEVSSTNWTKVGKAGKLRTEVRKEN